MKKSALMIIVSLLCACLVFAGCAKEAKPQATEAQAVAATEGETSAYDETSPKTAAWFDNAVFVGDSVTLKLYYYCMEHPEALGNAEFFCAGSLGYTNALWNLNDSEAVHPDYKGEKHRVEECVEVTGKKNVFIMLGMNDIGLYGTKGALDSCKKLIDAILAKSPDALIYIQSVTPMIEKAQFDSFNNKLVKEFDEMLKAYCEENKYKYLDIFSALADEKGNLPVELCSDPDNMGLHFNDTSCQMWVDYLLKNA